MADFKYWVSKVRTAAAWLALAAFVNFVIPYKIVSSPEYEASRHGGPLRPPEWALTWRNLSLIFLLVLCLLSFPKWQSLVSLGLTAILIFWAISSV